MSSKTYVPEGEIAPASQIGATIEALAATIAARRDAGEESYTHGLLTGKDDDVLKKVMEESGEVALAAKDIARADQAHRDAEHADRCGDDTQRCGKKSLIHEQQAGLQCKDIGNDKRLDRQLCGVDAGFYGV